MGFLDFLFGKKKSENTSVSNQQCSQTLKGKNVESVNIFPFTFESNQHQRYENGNPVQGLQECPRTVKVEKNINGCSGYQLAIGDGYIVRMINGDTGKPQMSAKPMRIVKSTSTEIVLRGYKVNAMTPFGYQEVDMGDYGLTIHLKEEKVFKCVLHMYDRNVDIEYRRVEILSDFMTDRYAKMVEESSFNPFKITLNPNLQKTLPMPNFVETFRVEIQDMFDKVRGMPSDQIYYLFKGYIFNLVESYYNNAGYVPKKIVDKLIEQAYEAIKLTTYANAVPSLDTVKYQVYYGFLHE